MNDRKITIDHLITGRIISIYHDGLISAILDDKIRIVLGQYNVTAAPLSFC